MQKHVLFCVSFVLGLVIRSQAQFSAGVLAGAGHRWERQERLVPPTLGGLGAVQPPVTAGVYGQFVTRGKPGLVVGLQLRYQSLTQSQRFAIPTGNPANPVEMSDLYYNRYRYLVATPYVGIRVLNRLELAAGPELSVLMDYKLVTTLRSPEQSIFGYNLRATYWLGRLGVEAAYSRQLTAYDSEGQLDGSRNFRFYNDYVYGAVKYALFGKVR